MGRSDRPVPATTAPTTIPKRWTRTRGNEVDWPRVKRVSGGPGPGGSRARRVSGQMNDQSTAAQPLQPPTATAPSEPLLTLTAPAPVTAVATTAAPKMAPAVDPAALPGLDAKVEDYLGSLMSAEPRSPEFAAKATDVRTMGDARHPPGRREQQPAAEARRSRRCRRAGCPRAPRSASRCWSCAARSRTSTRPRPPGVKKLLGDDPVRGPLTDYFRKYQSAQSHLDAILHALRDGQDELRKDNAALNLEKQQLWETMGRLNQYVYVAERLDARLSAAIADLEATDPERAKALREDVLFYVRQKHQDLLTQLAVSIQNYLAIDIVIKNNIELIKGVDRATTTTVSALRTAVIVAQALGNQKLVLDQITALNTTTSDDDRAHLRDAARQLGARSSSRRRRPRSGCRSCRRRSPTSTRRWTRSTPSRCRRWTPWPRPSARWRPRSASPASTSTACQQQDDAAGARLARPRAAPPDAALRRRPGDWVMALRRPAAGCVERRSDGAPSPSAPRSSCPRVPTADDLLAARRPGRGRWSPGTPCRPVVASRVDPGVPRPCARPCPGWTRLGVGSRAGLHGDGDRHRLPARGGRRLPAAAARLRRQPAGGRAARPR